MSSPAPTANGWKSITPGVLHDRQVKNGLTRHRHPQGIGQGQLDMINMSGTYLHGTAARRVSGRIARHEKYVGNVFARRSRPQGVGQDSST